ncbi:MAG: hypothetical protein CEN89_480 [Candidatus Berkelbacteria bacterium Licking1014_7]|uniref:Uncharacterized protein n=1 Tax=Candidatus Berkelbacteria bacterium Licking1014_7 TaxID=2017147 RepID=A0A554LIX0_9BACT|nr:MAG: hypothetical protein CEN89_480 [Candidatus Berkelbacteria bacterium Licking1014_7]
MGEFGEPGFSLKNEQTRRCALIEHYYQDLLNQYGHIKGGNLKEYLESWNNFQNYEEKNQPNQHDVVHYDIGRRFNIDALLNDEGKISEEEQAYIRDFFLSKTLPFYNSLEANDEDIQSFIQNYPNKESMVNSLIFLYRKARKQMLIIGLIWIWDEVLIDKHPPQKEGQKYEDWYRHDYIPAFKSWREFVLNHNNEYGELISVSSVYTDATTNSTLCDPLRKLIKRATENKVNFEMPQQELLEEAKHDLGVDFGLMPN